MQILSYLQYNKLRKCLATLIGFILVFTGCSRENGSRANSLPIINSISIFPQPVYTSANLLCSAYDPDGDSLSYTWNIGGIDVTTGSSAIWASPGIPGYYKVAVTVDDGHGGKVTGTSYMSIAGDSPWPILGGNIQSTGLSLINTSSTTGALKWSYTTGVPIGTSPVIGSDGTIYIGNASGNLYAINSNGGLKWSYTTGWGIGSSPIIIADGTIYVGSTDGNLYAIDSKGRLKWSYALGGPVNSEPAIGADGTIYVDDNNHLYAISPVNTLKWSYPVRGYTPASIFGPDYTHYSSPAIGADGTIYVGSGDGNFYAINPAGGLTWSYTTSGPIISSTMIGTDGTIYVESSLDNKLYAINSDGTLKWEYATEKSTILFPPAMGPDGTIYVSNGLYLYAINLDGTLKWELRGMYTSPVIGAEGTIYVDSYYNNFNLDAINPDGALKWSYTTGAPIGSPPAIGADGTIYVASSDGYLFAIH